MTAFRYRAARSDGEVVRGRLEAATAALAVQLVAERGLFALDVREEPRRGGPPRVAGAGALAEATAGLAAMLESGLPVDAALSAVAESSPPRLREALEETREQVRQGAALSAALAAAGVAAPVVVALVRAGERSGSLASGLTRAAEQLEHDAATRAAVSAALTYPAILGVAGAVSVAAIVGLVVPRFAALLGDAGRALPVSTRLLLGASATLGRFGPGGLAALAVFIALFLRWRATPHGSLALSGWLLGLPGVGALRLQLATARMCRALAGLLEAGVPMLQALAVARDVTGDAAVGERLAAARTEVERGERLGAALKRHGAMSATALRLAAFGEASGRLPSFLHHAARLEWGLAQRTVRRAVTLLEPLLILGFGIAVAFVAAALLQAVYSARPGL